jgi:hypothetical protein
MTLSTIFCNHYRAMSEHATCSAGVEYEKFNGLDFDHRPCFARRGNPPPGGCELAVFPTAEELAAKEERHQIRFANTMKAREAIVIHLGGPWKRGKPGAQGKIDCPVCGEKGTLAFSRAGYNGHIHARCMTKDCVAWME